MEKSLDQIIAERPKNSRRGSSRRGGRAQILGNAGPSPAAKARIAATTQQPKTTTAPAQTAEKIIVSNLPPDVNEAQIKELFHTTVGPLKEVTLHYDSAGKSKGAAIIHFQRKGDANKAFAQYNNRLIDGKRPMKIEILVDPSRSQTLAERVAPAPMAAAAAPSGEKAQPRTGGAKRGRGRGRGGRKNDRPSKSAADLDAEMEDYTGSSTPAAAPAPAAA